MSLDCLDGIIVNNLAINIDLTDVKSWVDYNTGLTAFSLTKWNGAISDNINLIDFGLTGFDNGRTDIMWNGITLTPSDTFFSMYKVGYNNVINPTTSQTSGIITSTEFLSITGITSTTGNYFNLDGGYLQGFFKLEDYNYTLFPSRCNEGITIETVIKLYPESQGIFYMMGARAEDKYNPCFSGETITGITTVTGVTTSENNYLDAILGKERNKKSFQYPEYCKETIYSETPYINNINNNVIAFELTSDKKIAYKYINGDGLLVTNFSPKPITSTGWTVISISFTPNNLISDLSVIDCVERRIGKLIIYVNGRPHWILKEFPEFYFHGFNNDREKQIGVPYSISWGGGSFGLENSWHYDYQTYLIYTGQDINYIRNNFSIHKNPTISDDYLSGLSLTADNTTFDNTVMCVKYTGGTENTHFIKFNNPISVLSNRDYTIDLSIFDDAFFKNTDNFGNSVNNKISIFAYSDAVDVNVINDVEYIYPLTAEYLNESERLGLHPFGDGQEYEYIYENGIMYYGKTGLPVLDEFGNLNEYGYSLINQISGNTVQNAIITGQNGWKQLKSIIRTDNGSGQNFVYIGLLIETSGTPNLNSPLFIKDFTYNASDILVQDETKNNLLIEQNFNNSFIGDIQKLRIYDRGLTSLEILHNALIESKSKSINVLNGGRIIGNNPVPTPSNPQWIYHVMYNNTLLYNYKIWNND